ncbi:replicative DNA helicase [Rickettsiales bacterium]|nr:replicative DNA helicase [Rickettsiales bacterium]
MAKDAIAILKDDKADEKNANYRVVPHNIQAEQDLLGALLTNNESINRVADYLRAEDFYEPVHERIYEAVIKFMDRGLVATPRTLKNYFDDDDALADLGGADYLAYLAGRATSIINLETYGQIVYDLSVRRKLIGIGENVVNDAYDNNIDSSGVQQIEEAEQSLFNLASEGTTGSGFRHLKESLALAIERADIAHKNDNKLSGISTQFTDLDELLGGLQDSDLLILAGRPSMGKTAFSINVAVNACKSLCKQAENSEQREPKSVGFFSLEMSSEQLAARMVAMEAAVDSSSMRVGNLSNEDFSKVVHANKALYNLPFYLDDTPALSISALRTRARRLKRRNNLGLLIVDYLQLLKGSSKSSEGSRVQEVSEITQGLKAIAKELNIPVIALSQLSRAVEQREDKRPQLSDLRESGSIEQDADVVMFIYREEYYEARRAPDADSDKFADWQARMDKCMNVTEIIIAKQRNGPIGTAKIFFDSKTTKFTDLDQNH